MDIDNTDTIQKEIVPLLKKISDICVKHGIPYFFTFAQQDDGEKTKYYTDLYSSAVSGVQLSDDRIVELINIMNGFTAVPEEPVFDMDLDL